MRSAIVNITIIMSCALSFSAQTELKTGQTVNPQRDNGLDCDILNKEWRALRGHKKMIYSLALSVDQKSLAASCYDGNIRIWDVATGKLLFHRKENAPSTIMLSPDGRSICLLYNVSGEYRIQGWKRTTLQLQWDYDHPGTDVIGMGTCFGASADGRTLAFCRRRESELGLWDMETGRSQGKIDVDGPINAFAFASTKSAVAIAYTSNRTGNNQLGLNTVGLWEFKERKLINILTELRDKDLHRKLRFSHDDKSVAELWEDERVRLIDVKSGKVDLMFCKQKYIKDIAFTSKNELWVLQQPWDETKVLDLWHANKDKRVLRIQCDPNRSIRDAILSNDASMVATAMDDGTVYLWKLQRD